MLFFTLFLESHSDPPKPSESAGLVQISSQASSSQSMTELQDLFVDRILLFLCWGPMAFMIITLIRSFKHQGNWVFIVHVIVAKIIFIITFIVAIRGLLGVILVLIIGLIITTGYIQSGLKIWSPDLSLKLMKFLKKLHMICGIAAIVVATILTYSRLQDLNASRTIQGIWMFSILIFISVFLLIDQSRAMGYFSKRPRLEQSHPQHYYSLDRMNSQLEQGKWLYLFENRVIELPKKFELFHPGGKAVLANLRGQDIGRYVTGSYKYKGKDFKHKHSPYALNFILRHSKGYLTQNMAISQYFFQTGSQLSNQPLRIQFRENMTSTVKRISFTAPNLQRKLFVADPTYWGKHFKYSAEVPWRIGKSKTITRYYTFCFSLGQQMRDYTDLLIMKWQKGGQFSEELDIEKETARSIDAFPKNYNHKKAFSTFLHNVDNLSVDNSFQIEGPMGFGLKLQPGAYGKHIAITAGTGILPFIDLVFYLLRRNIYQIGQREFRRLNIFKNEYEQPSIADDFVFELWASFFEQEEVIALKYITLLERISREHDFNNFKFLLRLSGSDHWDKEYLSQKIDMKAKKIWVRGTQKFNESIRDELLRIGVEREVIDEL